MKRPYFAPTLSVIAMILIIALAAGLDQLVNILREQASRTAYPYPVLWCYTLGNLLLAGLLVALSIWVLFQSPRNLWVAVVYLIVGLYISAFPLLYFSPVGPFILNFGVGARSFLAMAGGIIAFIGLAVILDPARRLMNKGYNDSVRL